MKVTGPRVLVRPIEAPRPKSSLLYIPDTVESDASPYALVIGVGTGSIRRDGTREPITDVAVGDTVIVKKYSMSPVTIDGQPVSVVMHGDILAVVDLA